MGFSLNLKCDNASAGAVARLWDAVSGFEDTASMRPLNYAPHFSFAVYDSEFDEARARNAINRAAAGETALRMSFSRIRTFAGPPLILWAEPKFKEPLVRMHAAIHAAIDPAMCRPHYRPPSWVPHCTLGTGVSEGQSEAARAFAESFRGSVEAIFDVIDCVTFPPLEVRIERRLPLPA